LTPYGLGPNLTYEVIRFEEEINITAEILKIRQIKPVRLENLDQYTIKGTYFSDSCGLYSNYCPLAIDYFNQPQKINCSHRLA
jgi:hypothetical protein